MVNVRRTEEPDACFEISLCAIALLASAAPAAAWTYREFTAGATIDEVGAALSAKGGSLERVSGVASSNATEVFVVQPASVPVLTFCHGRLSGYSDRIPGDIRGFLGRSERESVTRSPAMPQFRLDMGKRNSFELTEAQWKMAPDILLTLSWSAAGGSGIGLETVTQDCPETPPATVAEAAPPPEAAQPSGGRPTATAAPTPAATASSPRCPRLGPRPPRNRSPARPPAVATTEPEPAGQPPGPPTPRNRQREPSPIRPRKRWRTVHTPGVDIPADDAAAAASGQTASRPPPRPSQGRAHRHRCCVVPETADAGPEARRQCRQCRRGARQRHDGPGSGASLSSSRRSARTARIRRRRTSPWSCRCRRKRRSSSRMPRRPPEPPPPSHDHQAIVVPVAAGRAGAVPGLHGRAGSAGRGRRRLPARCQRAAAAAASGGADGPDGAGLRRPAAPRPPRAPGEARAAPRRRRPNCRRSSSPAGQRPRSRPPRTKCLVRRPTSAAPPRSRPRPAPDGRPRSRRRRPAMPSRATCRLRLSRHLRRPVRPRSRPPLAAVHAGGLRGGVPVLRPGHAHLQVEQRRGAALSLTGLA